MTTEELDCLVLSAARLKWRKVAFLVGAIGQSLPDDLAGDPYVLIAQRIVALVEAGKLDAQGDLTQWRFSEVRLSQNQLA